MSLRSRGMTIISSGNNEVEHCVSVSEDVTHISSLKLHSSSDGVDVHEALTRSSYDVEKSVHTSEMSGGRSIVAHDDQQRSQSDALDVDALQTAVAGLQLERTSAAVETRIEITIDQQTQYHGNFPDPEVQIENPIPYSYHTGAHSGEHECQPVVEKHELSGDRYEVSQTFEAVESSYREVSHGQYSSRNVEQASVTLLEPNASDNGVRYETVEFGIEGDGTGPHVHDSGAYAEDYQVANHGGDPDCSGYVDDFDNGYNDFDDGYGDADDYDGGFDDYGDYDDCDCADDYDDDY